MKLIKPLTYYLCIVAFVNSAIGESTPENVLQFKKMAQQGDAKAQYELGVCYYYGDGVEKDLKKAKEWIEKARKAGYSEPDWAQVLDCEWPN